MRILLFARANKRSPPSGPMAAMVASPAFAQQVAIIGLMTIVAWCSLMAARVQAQPQFEYFGTAGRLSNGRLAKALNNFSHTHDNDQVDLNLTSEAWSMLEQRYKNYIESKIYKSRPYIKDLLRESNVSSQCASAIGVWLDRLVDLEQWAALMWNSWGDFPPAGFFEGSFTDLGSYRGCLNVEDNKFIGQAQYCMIDFQPLVPTRPRFHSIYKRILDVDSHNQLTGGDFHAADKISSRHSAHGFSSAKFQSITSNPTKQQSSFLVTSSNSSPTAPSNNSRSLIQPSGGGLRTSVMVALARRAQFLYYMRLRIGSCWPTKCSRKDVQSIAQSTGARAVLQVTKVSCVTRSERQSFEINTHQWVAIVMLSSLAAVTLLASLLDALCNLLTSFEFSSLATEIRALPRVEKFLDICSLLRNARRLFSTSSSAEDLPAAAELPASRRPASADPKSTTTATTSWNNSNHLEQSSAKPPSPPPAPRHLTCLQGLRFISAVTIIIGHTLLAIDYQLLTHSFRSLDDLDSIATLPIMNSNFGVDTFFVMSGLLSSYIIFSQNIKFNGLLYMMARYIRLTPQLVIVILIFFLLPLIGDGPLYRELTADYANKCYKNYWIDLTYLQAYINRRELCIVPTWWLSIEMTFHVISLPVIYVLFKRPKLGLWLNAGITVAMTLVGCHMHYSKGFAIQYLPSVPQRYEVEFEQTQGFFHKPYPHAASFFIGLALGYVMAKRLVERITKFGLLLGWLVCCMGFVITLVGSYYWNQGAPYTQLEATIYYNVCQILWPISIGWLILTCYLGYGGPVDAILSAKILHPLGRVTYMTYLSHIIIVYWFAASIKQTMEPSSLNLLGLCVSNCVLSFSFGTVLSLVYEGPMLRLQKLAYQKKYVRVEATVIGSADTNGMSGQQIIVGADNKPVGNKKRSPRSRYTYRALIGQEQQQNVDSPPETTNKRTSTDT